MHWHVSLGKIEGCSGIEPPSKLLALSMPPSVGGQTSKLDEVRHETAIGRYPAAGLLFLFSVLDWYRTPGLVSTVTRASGSGHVSDKPKRPQWQPVKSNNLQQTSPEAAGYDTYHKRRASLLH